MIAELFEGKALIRQFAEFQNHPFALRQRAERRLQPVAAPLGINRAADQLIGQRRGVDHQIAARGALGFIGIGNRRVDGLVRTAQPHIHHRDIIA